MTAASLESLSYPNTNPENTDYLVIMLHGWGANYYDLQPLAEMLHLPNCQFLFPNAPFPHFQVPLGRAWYALEREDFWGLEESRDRLLSWLESLPAATGIPPERTAMIGFSQGGAMTLDVGLEMGLAALCSCSGYLHYDPTGRDGQFSPTLIIHGAQDEVVPLNAAQQAKNEFAQLGVPVEYFEFRGGHEIPNVALEAMQKFLQKHLLKSS